MASAPERDPDETIAELYRAATGSSPWPQALQRMVDDLDGLAAQFLGIDKRSNAIAFSHVSEAAPADAPLEYIRKYHAVDPRIPLVLPRPVGDWLFCQDHFDDDFAAANPYYRDMLIPFGGRFSATCKIAESESEVVVISVLSKGTNPAFTPEDREYFRRMSRHLQESLAMHRKLRGVMRAGAVGANLIARVPRPIAVLDATRTLSATNTSFEELLAEGTLFQQEQHRLRCLDSEVDRKLGAALVELAATPAAERRARVFRLEGREPPYFAVSVSLVAPEETMHAFGDTAQYLLSAHKRPTGPHEDVSLWAAAFSLSPAECKVAAHLFSGKPPKEIAKALHVSPSTIKTHLDSLFAKTKTGRQAELVRVLGMVVD